MFRYYTSVSCLLILAPVLTLHCYRAAKRSLEQGAESGETRLVHDFGTVLVGTAEGSSTALRHTFTYPIPVTRDAQRELPRLLGTSCSCANAEMAIYGTGASRVMNVIVEASAGNKRRSLYESATVAVDGEIVKYCIRANVISTLAVELKNDGVVLMENGESRTIGATVTVAHHPTRQVSRPMIAVKGSGLRLQSVSGPQVISSDTEVVIKTYDVVL